MSNINQLVQENILIETKSGELATKAAGGSVAAVYTFFPSLVLGGVVGATTLLATLSLPIAMLIATVAFATGWGGATAIGASMAGRLHGRFDRKEKIDKKMIDYYDTNKNKIKENLIKAAKSNKLDKKLSSHIIDLAKKDK